MIEEFGCEEFIFCSDAGLGSENNLALKSQQEALLYRNPVYQKLPEEYRTLALNKKDSGASQTIKRSI